MLLHPQGKADSAEFFLPMALQAYAMLPALDVDARYHIGVLDLSRGDAAGALAQADTIRRAVPTHLFGFMLRARALDLKRDAAGARRAYADFLKNEAAERTRQRPERSEEHTSELQSPCNLVCRLLLEKKKKILRQHSMSCEIPEGEGRHPP